MTHAPSKLLLQTLNRMAREFAPLPLNSTHGEVQAATPEQRRDYYRRLRDQWIENTARQLRRDHEHDTVAERDEDWTR